MRAWVWTLAPLPVYVVLSSWFGLTRDSMFHSSSNGIDSNPRAFFGSVWQANAGADLLFALGTAAVGLGALWAVLYVHRRWRVLSFAAALVAGGLSILANWLVYGLSYMAMVQDWARKNVQNADPQQPNFGDSMHFVWDWGWPGLVWVTALFPVAFLAVLEIRRAMSPQWVEIPATTEGPAP